MLVNRSLNWTWKLRSSFTLNNRKRFCGYREEKIYICMLLDYSQNTFVLAMKFLLHYFLIPKAQTPKVWIHKSNEFLFLITTFSSRETYNALTKWLTDARTLASPNIVIIMCGNKKDLDADREVTFLEASRFAQENGKNKMYHFGGGTCAICSIL